MLRSKCNNAFVKFAGKESRKSKSKMKSAETIPAFEDIIDFIEDARPSAPHQDELYYLNLLKTMAEKAGTQELRTDVLLAMFYCYLKIKEYESSTKP
jgi:hypothetical protein